MALNLYHTLSQLSKIKRKELVLPIAKKQVVVSPLSVGDDLILKTALISPAKMDKELMKLLWRHTEFWVPNLQQEKELESTSVENKRGRKRMNSMVANDNTAGQYKKISEKDFYNQISYFDKLFLLWGIYNITYVSLGSQEITCPHCNFKFQDEIQVEDTLHEDSLTIFEEDIPFSQYTENIQLPFNDEYILDFSVGIPSMADFNRIMGLLTTAELQSNLESIHTSFNTEQLMTLYTKKLSIYSKEKKDEKVESQISQEILSSLRDFVNIDVSTEFFKQYAEKFSKYAVNFYKKYTCPECKESFNVGVDIEYHFFLKQLPR